MPAEAAPRGVDDDDGTAHLETAESSRADRVREVALSGPSLRAAGTRGRTDGMDAALWLRLLMLLLMRAPSARARLYTSVPIRVLWRGKATLLRLLMILLMRAPSARARQYTPVAAHGLWEGEAPSRSAGGVLVVVVEVLAGMGWWLVRYPGKRTASEELSSLTSGEPGHSKQRNRREGSSTRRANRGTRVGWRNIVLLFRRLETILCNDRQGGEQKPYSNTKQSHGHPTFESDRKACRALSSHH